MVLIQRSRLLRLPLCLFRRNWVLCHLVQAVEGTVNGLNRLHNAVFAGEVGHGGQERLQNGEFERNLFAIEIPFRTPGNVSAECVGIDLREFIHGHGNELLEALGVGCDHVLDDLTIRLLEIAVEIAPELALFKGILDNLLRRVASVRIVGELGEDATFGLKCLKVAAGELVGFVGNVNRIADTALLGCAQAAGFELFLDRFVEFRPA